MIEAFSYTLTCGKGVDSKPNIFQKTQLVLSVCARIGKYQLLLLPYFENQSFYERNEEEKRTGEETQW